jgi:hypothetical protein
MMPAEKKSFLKLQEAVGKQKLVPTDVGRGE